MLAHGKKEGTFTHDRKNGHWGTPVLSQDDIECGKESRQKNKGKIARKAGHQSPTEHGRYTIPKPRLVDAGDTVQWYPVVSSQLKRSQRRGIDLQDPSEYDRWTYHSSLIESVCGLDLLIPSPRHDTITTWFRQTLCFADKEVRRHFKRRRRKVTENLFQRTENSRWYVPRDSRWREPRAS